MARARTRRTPRTSRRVTANNTRHDRAQHVRTTTAPAARAYPHPERSNTITTR